MRTLGTLIRTEKGWSLTAEPHVILRAKRIFAGVSKQHSGTLELSATAENARDLAWFIERYPLAIDAALKIELDGQASAHRERESMLAMLLAGQIPARPFELSPPPREYQRVGADMWLRVGGLLLADDLGVGKTVTAICGLTDPRSRPALVVTMTSLTRQWQREINRFAPTLRTHVLKKGTPYDITRKPRTRHNPDQLALGGGLVMPGAGGTPDIIITSYSKLSGWAETLAGLVNSVVFDEVQELRHGKGSNKGSAAYAIAERAALRLGMTATPIYNYGGEIFNVLEALVPGALGSWEEFCTEWCEYAGQDKWKLKDAKAFGTFARDSGFMLRRTRADVGRELPERTIVLHDVETDSKPLEDIATAAEKLAEIIIARSASFRNEVRDASRDLDVLVRHATGVAKAPYVAEFVRLLVESGQSVVLFGWHRDVYRIWMERLSDLNPALYTGSESANQKDEAARAFIGRTEVGERTEPTAKVLIMSLRAGVGLDGLQDACQTVVFGELDWSPGVHEQCIGRVHRDGQKGNVAVYYMVADEGSDPVVIDVLGVKREQVESLRNPNQDHLEKLEVDAERIRVLAEQYLSKPRAPRATKPPAQDAAHV